MTVVAALLLALIGTDRLGDPLGPGVTARYGTTRLCVETYKVRAIRFHPTRDEVYVVREEAVRGAGMISGWKRPSGAACFRHATAHDIHFAPTGRSRVLVGASESVVWDDATGRRIATVPHPPKCAFRVVGFDGDRLLATTYAHSEAPYFARVFRIADGKPTECAFAHGRWCQTALSSDGRKLFVADAERAEIRVHSASTGLLQSWRPLFHEPDTDSGMFARLSADGKRAVTIQLRVEAKADRYRGFPECFIRVVDTATHRTEARYDFRLDDVDDWHTRSEPEYGDPFLRSLTVSNDGEFFAWKDSTDRLWIRHLPTGRVVTPPGRYDHRSELAFSPNGKWLAFLDGDSVVRLIDPYTGRFQHAADNPATAAKQTAISPDGKLVATGHACGEVWVWDAATGKPHWHTEPDGSEVREVHFNPTGTTVSAVGFWGPIGVRTWNAKTGKELGPMLSYRYYRTIAVSADGKRIADLIEEKSVMEKGGWAYPLFVRTREVATGKEVKRVRLDHRLGLGNETNAVVSRNGRVMVVTHNADGGETIAYDTATGKRLVEFDRPKRGPASRWTVSEDGRMVIHTAQNVIGGPPLSSRISGRTATVYDLTSQQPGKPIRVLDSGSAFGHSGLSPDGRYLTLSREVFDIRTGDLVSEPHMAAVAFFPDGRSALTLPGIRGAERVSLEPLAWKVAPPAKPTEARLKQLWSQLGEPAAMDAVFELARHSAEAVPFLKAKLLTNPPDATAVAAHVERLGSKLFADREDASKALRAAGPEVLPALRAALTAGPSPEVRSRIEKLLALHADTAAPFTLARLRAVEVLERCGTPDARAALKTLADTRPGTPWADDAARALVRREGVKN